MERVCSRAQCAAKRREPEPAAVTGDGDATAAPPTKSPCNDRLPPSPDRDRCSVVAEDRSPDLDRCCSAVKSYCRDRNLPTDLYRPVAAGRCGEFRLTDLIGELHRVFAEDRVNVEYVRYLMESYRSDPAEWLKYAKFNKFRYTRNLVDAGNGKFNLMVLCWGEGDGSSIHDHPESECVMKILAGQLTEVKFAWPEKSEDDDDDEGANGDDDRQLRPMCEIGRRVLETDRVCHINDSMGLHRVENASHTDKAVSLHLYCPPFEECSTFNQQTGHRVKAKSTFWSIYGEKVSKIRAVEHVPDDN